MALGFQAQPDTRRDSAEVLQQFILAMSLFLVHGLAGTCPVQCPASSRCCLYLYLDTVCPARKENDL